MPASSEQNKNVNFVIFINRKCIKAIYAVKFHVLVHHFILLLFNPFDLRVDWEGWWFEHSMSYLQVCLSAEGAKNVSWPWLSPLRGWGSVTKALPGKFVYMAHDFIVLWLNLFDLRADRKGWGFERSVLYLRVCLSA